MSCASLPPGHLPYGYSVYSFTERLAGSGPEATVVYVGPSRYRFRFLSSLTGSWFIVKDEVTKECCACLAEAPCPYPSYTKLDADLVGCYSDRDCLYVDTYSISPFDPNSTPTVDDCPAAINRPCERPFFYGDGNDQNCDCAAAITVNYRSMTHAGFPRYFDACELQDVWSTPNVSVGTFIEARISSALSINRIPSKSLEYNPAREYKKNTVGSPCVPATIASAEPAPAFCVAGTSAAVDSELSPGRVRNTELLEIKWSNVPLPNWNKINALKGRVNDTVFLGYPPESVLFETAEPFIRPSWGHDGNYCGEIYDIVYRFTVLTAEVDCTGTTYTEQDLLKYGIYKGRVGLWNRLWSNVPIALDGTCCTNWVPVKVKEQGCCDTSERRIYELSPVVIGDETYCFNDLFTINECLQCYEDCPENWPDCAFVPPDPPA